MTDTQMKAQITGLVEAMYAEFSEQMAPSLPPDQNYRAAMMKRGLEILAAHLRSEHAVKDASFSEQSGYSAAELAQALRNRDPAVMLSDKLHKLLAEDVQRRCAQANPNASISSAQNLRGT